MQRLHTHVDVSPDIISLILVSRMFRKFLAFLPLVGIATACSSGVVDTWDPKAEVARQEATKQSKEEKCWKIKQNPTHMVSKSYKKSSSEQRRLWIDEESRTSFWFHLDGKKLYTSGCTMIGEIGKTKERDTGFTIYIDRLLLEDDEIVRYSRPKNGGKTEITGRYFPLDGKYFLMGETYYPANQ